MTPLLFACLAFAGGIGAALRFFVDGTIRDRSTLAFPLGTMVINLSGSFLLGAVTGALSATALPTEWGLALGVGLLGGYTTFSTASFDTIGLARKRRYGAALINGVGMLLAAVAAAALGYGLVTLLTS